MIQRSSSTVPWIMSGRSMNSASLPEHLYEARSICTRLGRRDWQAMCKTDLPVVAQSRQVGSSMKRSSNMRIRNRSGDMQLCDFVYVASTGIRVFEQVAPQHDANPGPRRASSNLVVRRCTGNMQRCLALGTVS